MRGRGRLLLRDATGFVDLLQVLEGGLGELANHALHEALAARKEVLQEAHVSTVGRQQQSHIGEVLDCGQR